MLMILVAFVFASSAAGFQSPRAGAPAGRRLGVVRMAQEITMPALSSTMTSGRVVSWLKSVGDKVEAGDPIIVVESDKADMEVESYEDGYLAQVLIGEGEDAAVGATIGILANSLEDVENIRDVEIIRDQGEAPSPLGAEESAGISVTMPALSSTMKSGRVVSWLKAVGEKVEAGDPVMVVESDKADMEVESYEDGYLAAIFVEEGAEADVGAPVAVLAPTESEIAAVAAAGAAPVAPTPPEAAAPPAPVANSVASQPSGDGHVAASGYARKLAADRGVDVASLKGSGPGGRVVAADVAAGTAPSWVATPGATTATPSARKLAKSKNIDIAAIEGTGNFGRVTLADVEAALGAPSKKKKKTMVIVEEEGVLAGPVEMSGMQRAIAKNMEATLAVPVFRVSKVIETDAFDALYQKLKPDGVTVSALLAKAVALSLKKYPLINAKYEPGTIVYNPNINVAMAVALDGGLITPTLRDADKLSLPDLSASWKDLVAKAKAKTLAPEEYSTGTFTISNLGMFDVAHFDAILPPGQGSILAVGSSKQTVVPVPNAVLGVGIVKQMTVTLTCDHRIIGGADAAAFLADLKKTLEAPAALAK
ncbi:hypothetical protein CTAYLR_002601 [Chrysophaeum taylorii]|uniref:Dihydrolipoamide acetyltransferase component of pyruvate dehydrogenase complex n=1 Tax=Chrysophaeum taylorii TaxID=2483200 RepID=A0AAD7UDX1_9STRA|nr:hypothetical protein CTAYLR_002601 [Chrysophaeum taylorii]